MFLNETVAISGNEFMDTLKKMKLSLNKSTVERILNLEDGFLRDEEYDGKVLLAMK